MATGRLLDRGGASQKLPAASARVGVSDERAQRWWWWWWATGGGGGGGRLVAVRVRVRVRRGGKRNELDGRYAVDEQKQRTKAAWTGGSHGRWAVGAGGGAVGTNCHWALSSEHPPRAGTPARSRLPSMHHAWVLTAGRGSLLTSLLSRPCPSIFIPSKSPPRAVHLSLRPPLSPSICASTLEPHCCAFAAIVRRLLAHTPLVTPSPIRPSTVRSSYL